MRIIKRITTLEPPDRYIVQDVSWNGAAAYQNSIGTINIKPYVDIGVFLSLESAKEFAYKYKNNLKSGEELVCEL